MAVKTFSPVLGKRIRVTVLDECGKTPDPGTEDSFLVTDGFVTVTLSAETEEGAEITQKRADGTLCINERLSPSFKRLNAEILFCGVNPALASMVTNAEPYMDAAGDVIGFTVPEGEMTKKFALEIWTGLAGQACAEGADVAAGYLLLPFVNAGVVGNIEIGGESAVNFQMTGASTKGGNMWGSGPFDVVKDETGEGSKLPTAIDPLDHLLMVTTGLAYPPSADDPQPMPTAA